MKSRILYALPLSLAAATLSAQSGTVPPGYATTDGPSYFYYMGRYPEMRCQISNGDLTGKTKFVAKEVSFRQDAGTYSSSAVGRKWTKVTMLMATTTNAAALNSTWTMNHATTPTTVYSMAHSFPPLTSQPTGSPNPWNNGGLRFPFTGVYAYAAAKDLLMDITFQGGTLSNAGAWGPGSSNSKTYYLDGVNMVTSSGGGNSVGGLNPKTFPCAMDSKSPGQSPSIWGPYSTFVHFSYAKVTGNPTYDNKMRYYGSIANNAAPNSTVIQAITWGGTTNVNDPLFPTKPFGCTPLMVDLNKLILINHIKTGSTGRGSTPSTYVPFVHAAVGINIHSQAVWNDSGNGYVKLSWASKTTIQKQPLGATFVGQFLYAYTSTSATRNGTNTSVPVYRYQ